MIIGIVLGIVVSVFNTRILGAETFGDFKFIQSVYSFFTIIISFGYVVTASKLLAEKKNESLRKELIGASVIITIVLGVIFIFTIAVFSLFQESFFATDLSKVFLFLSPLFFFVPFTQSLENVLQGENRIYELSFYRILPQILYIGAIVVLYKLNLISLDTVVLIQLLSFGFSSFFIIYLLKPRFSNLKSAYELIFHENRKYGFQVYIGSVIGVASTQFGPIAISFFSTNNIDVGFYSLAMTITMPLVLIPTVVGTSMFKEFANRNEIPKKATKATVLISILSLIVFLIIIKPLIVFLYSVEYIEAVNLAYIVAVGQIFHGFGNYYNRFLGSKGQGKYLRNGAISVGIANIAGFILIVPFYGATGAAVTKLCSGIVFTVSMLFYYNKFKKKN
jgi:O-antigen/teichoic acid export membrane protein